MGKRGYNKCVELLNKAKKEGIKRISRQHLEILIMRYIGGDDRTIKSNFRLMKALGMIEPKPDDQWEIK